MHTTDIGMEPMLFAYCSFGCLGLFYIGMTVIKKGRNFYVRVSVYLCANNNDDCRLTFVCWTGNSEWILLDVTSQLLKPSSMIYPSP
jgi:hypothetical protein